MKNNRKKRSSNSANIAGLLIFAAIPFTIATGWHYLEANRLANQEFKNKQLLNTDKKKTTSRITITRN